MLYREQSQWSAADDTFTDNEGDTTVGIFACGGAPCSHGLVDER
jgi:hypothetical protein